MRKIKELLFRAGRWVKSLFTRTGPPITSLKLEVPARDVVASTTEKVEPMVPPTSSAKEEILKDTRSLRMETKKFWLARIPGALIVIWAILGALAFLLPIIIYIFAPEVSSTTASYIGLVGAGLIFFLILVLAAIKYRQYMEKQESEKPEKTEGTDKAKKESVKTSKPFDWKIVRVIATTVAAILVVAILYIFWLPIQTWTLLTFGYDVHRMEVGTEWSEVIVVGPGRSFLIDRFDNVEYEIRTQSENTYLYPEDPKGMRLSPCERYKHIEEWVFKFQIRAKRKTVFYLNFVPFTPGGPCAGVKKGWSAPKADT